ncbi:hypothetical protein [Caudoviricetes sp.]|nr:hypothetical protein [Caudoviricetes sp.]
MTNEDIGFDEWTDIIKEAVLKKNRPQFSRRLRRCGRNHR